ncbi:MAG: helix-turn-helix domain-containing protein [Candidatus Methylomirabilales bacterium]
MQRARLAITQAALADRLGMSPPSLCRVERAPTPVPRELAVKIHVALRERQERPPFMRKAYRESFAERFSHV